jgi:hypothetical protein
MVYGIPLTTASPPPATGIKYRLLAGPEYLKLLFVNVSLKIVPAGVTMQNSHEEFPGLILIPHGFSTSITTVPEYVS